MGLAGRKRLLSAMPRKEERRGEKNEEPARFVHHPYYSQHWICHDPPRFVPTYHYLRLSAKTHYTTHPNGSNPIVNTHPTGKKIARIYPPTAHLYVGYAVFEARSFSSGNNSPRTATIEIANFPPAGVEGMEGGVAPPKSSPWPILVRMLPSISAKKLRCWSFRRATSALRVHSKKVDDDIFIQKSKNM